MSDFDDVLERLLTDPTFQARLAADPQSALAGYQLDEEERGLLGAQLMSGDAADRTVELRTSKSGIVGLLGPVMSAFGVAATGGSELPKETFGQAPGGSTGPHESLGYAPDHHGRESMGHAPAPVQSMGSQVADPGHSTLGGSPHLAENYHTRVDADGDGNWDAYTAYDRPDGGVDIHVDMDGDGRVDFIGHDDNRDGLVDSADFDNDHDGTFETRMYDDTGDGWMDRSESVPTQGPKETFGQAPR